MYASQAPFSVGLIGLLCSCLPFSATLPAAWAVVSILVLSLKMLASTVCVTSLQCWKLQKLWLPGPLLVPGLCSPHPRPAIFLSSLMQWGVVAHAGIERPAECLCGSFPVLARQAGSPAGGSPSSFPVTTTTPQARAGHLLSPFLPSLHSRSHQE